MNQKFKLERIIDLVETWLITGDLNTEMLADDFCFISPFWKGNSKHEFIEKFKDPTAYKEKSLSKIIKFDPLIKFKSLCGNYFTIILQFHTKNDHRVYEAVFGKISDGLLVELRSIYDLNEIKEALQL